MRRLNTTPAFAMPIVLITIFFVMTIIAVVSSYASANYKIASDESYLANARLTADAGIDTSINELNVDPNWTGTGGEVTLLDTSHMRTTYESQLLDGAGDNEKILAVVARTYAPSTATEPKVERRYELDLRAVTSGTSASSVVSGVGGLLMNNNSKITGGDVVVNGEVEMNNQSQIGTQFNAVNVRIAHHSCPKPADENYPELCGSSDGEPISMQNNARIYADVKANNQVDDNNMFDPGLTANSGVDPIDLPVYDRTQHDGATEYSPSSSTIDCPNNGSTTWPADIKITGDVDLGNSCELTLMGDVWITGNFSTGNNGEIYVSDTLGTESPVIMVDGNNGFTLSNNGEVIPNSSDSGIELYSFWSDSGCGADCTELTGQALKNSLNRVTINLGNNGEAPNSAFIAQWSRVRVSNNGELGAVAGQSIELSNQAVINFSSSVPGSDNLTTTWVKRGFIRVYD
ncbi:MAG: hypothetical protein U5L95_05685 [Candidatus Saccharibacteria bacterium]|nr:hypothetical protein [Candidatus Saccharibacteria bacterium]